MICCLRILDIGLTVDPKELAIWNQRDYFEYFLTFKNQDKKFKKIDKIKNLIPKVDYSKYLIQTVGAYIVYTLLLVIKLEIMGILLNLDFLTGIRRATLPKELSNMALC